MSETDNKNTPEDLCIIKRFTKQQVAEVHNLLEEGKTLDEISKFFQRKYKCKPLSKWRLQKHQTNFFKKLEENEKLKTETDETDLTHETNKVIENKIHSVRPYNTYNTYRNQEIERKEDGLSAINLKFLIFILFFIFMAFKILNIIQKRRKKEPEPEPVYEPESIKERLKRQGLM